MWYILSYVNNNNEHSYTVFTTKMQAKEPVQVTLFKIKCTIKAY